MRTAALVASLVFLLGLLAAAPSFAQTQTDSITALTGTWDLVGTNIRLKINPDHTVDHSLLGAGDIKHDIADRYRITYHYRDLQCTYEVRMYRDTMAFTRGIPQDAPACDLGTMKQPQKAQPQASPNIDETIAQLRRLATFRQLIADAATTAELDIIQRAAPELKSQIDERKRILATRVPAERPPMPPTPPSAIGWARFPQHYVDNDGDLNVVEGAAITSAICETYCANDSRCALYEYYSGPRDDGRGNVTRCNLFTTKVAIHKTDANSPARNTVGYKK